ncbi:hypothetical protein KP509_10G032500 [Ceratopteris richardii]|uniref:WW domain-containing protein n=1 Tax=Ceratopteris richardii TaxID=49495 RepID=A0A8T2TW89_CERRI|nr:hypothetical protein KP509_10G032500 [Ceratopteris richardii]
MSSCDIKVSSVNEDCLVSLFSSFAPSWKFGGSTIDPGLSISNPETQCAATTRWPCGVECADNRNHLLFPTSSCNSPSLIFNTADAGGKCHNDDTLVQSPRSLCAYIDEKHDLQQILVNRSIEDLHQASVTTTGLGTSAKAGNPSSRKRDWMTSFLDSSEGNLQSSPTSIFTQSPPALSDGELSGASVYRVNDMGTSSCRSSSLHKSSPRSITGHFRFPPGWEQYFDIQTGGSYFVNWNTRTKHSRIDCPEVQKCLGSIQHQHHKSKTLLSIPSANDIDDTRRISHNSNNRKAEAAEAWLSKMTANASAIMEKKSRNSKISALGRPRSFRSKNV